MSRRRHEPPDSPTSVGWIRPRQVRLATPEDPFELEVGHRLDEAVVEYETYGDEANARDRCVLVTHALSGDAHAAGWDESAEDSGRPWRTRKPGWWDNVIGPGKPIDTRNFFVVCSNVLGGCYGTTGPGSADPATGRRYGLRFPVVTVEDWVRLQVRLMDHLGVGTVHAVVGGSLGGQQALEWALAHPGRVRRALCLAASPRLSTQGMAFNAVGRQAITSDRDFHDGDYYDRDTGPDAGLAVARMMAHITYLSEEGMTERFGRRRATEFRANLSTGAEFEVESYLDYQGRSFSQRFDANAYLYITKAMDYYDAAARWGEGDLAAACARIESEVMVVSFSSDWLYTPSDCRDLAMAMCRVGKPVTYADVPSRAGHDAFLVEAEPVGRLLRGFLGEGDA